MVVECGKLVVINALSDVDDRVWKIADLTEVETLFWQLMRIRVANSIYSYMEG